MPFFYQLLVGAGFAIKGIYLFPNTITLEEVTFIVCNPFLMTTPTDGFRWQCYMIVKIFVAFYLANLLWCGIVGIAFPQGFVLPISGESHCCGVHHRIIVKQLRELFFEVFASLHGIKPISDTAKDGIQFVAVHLMVSNPQTTQTYIQLRCGIEETVPKAGMMGAVVTEGCKAAHPTLKDFMLRQVETMGYLFLHFLVGEVVIEFGKCTKGGQFERFPSRGNSGLS